MEACGDDRMDSEVSEGSEEADSSEEEAIVQGRQQSGFHASTSQVLDLAGPHSWMSHTAAKRHSGGKSSQNPQGYQ